MCSNAALFIVRFMIMFQSRNSLFIMTKNEYATDLNCVFDDI